MSDGIRTRLAASEPTTMFAFFKNEPAKSQAAGVDALISTFVLSFEADQSSSGKAALARAWNRLWDRQSTEGPNRGAWPWLHLKLDPWESENSAYFGATLAAIALGAAPPASDIGAGKTEHIALLKSFLKSEKSRQPLHGKLMLLWASTRLPGLLTPAEQKELREAVLTRVRPDGGISIDTLGPWSFNRQGVAGTSNAYATAFAAYVVRQSAAACADPRANRMLEWLRSHQDTETGAWQSPTLTKQYPAGSMQESFMNDAATAFAILALLDETCHAGAKTPAP